MTDHYHVLRALIKDPSLDRYTLRANDALEYAIQIIERHEKENEETETDDTRHTERRVPKASQASVRW